MFVARVALAGGRAVEAAARAPFAQKHGEEASAGFWHAASTTPTKDSALASGVRASGAPGESPGAAVVVAGTVGVLPAVAQSQYWSSAQSVSTVQAGTAGASAVAASCTTGVTMAAGGVLVAASPCATGVISAGGVVCAVVPRASMAAVNQAIVRARTPSCWCTMVVLHVLCRRCVVR